MPVKPGAKVPKFSLLDQSGKSRSFSDLKSQFVVFYFYPKDDTPGCTIEAREFSKRVAKFRALGAVVVGVSGGDEKSKQRFCEKHGIKVTLLADPDFKVSKLFGAYGEKQFMGRKFNGILRKTFVANSSGKIIQIFADVKAAGHAAEVLDFLKESGAARKSLK